jgi:hypothetical protein
MESINSFSNGQNSDLSKTILSKDSYSQALNFRPLTELGSSNGSLVNIKGNECKITFPTIHDIYKLKVVDNNGGGGNESLTITINGQTTSSIQITNSTKGVDLYNLIIALPNCYNTTNNVPATSTFAVAYKDDYVVIYQNPEYVDCGPAVNSVSPLITLNTTVGATADWTVGWVRDDNSISIGNPQYPFVLTNNYPILIGHTFIGDEIYLFTQDYTTGYSVPPNPANDIPLNDSFVGVGHIWKLTINDITRQHTLKLLYTNYVDFTREHPIAPSAATGRYESGKVKRIYWSDFYNKIRTANVADDQLMALDVKLLSISPSTEFSQPVLNQIIAGSIITGTYQLAYRVKQDLGAISNISELSNVVHIITPSLTGPFQDYQGSPAGNSGKGIEWKIDDLDTSFDKVEFFVLHREEKNAVPNIITLGDYPIPLTGSMTISYTDPDVESYLPVTLDDFLALASSFTHAKTVDTKDNRLFWGNVKTLRKDLIYDARAFRARTSGLDDVYLINTGISSIFQATNPAGANYAGDLSEEEDTINEYYTSTGAFGTNACYYKPGTNRLGGLGPNISYEFGTKSILVDDSGGIETSDDWQISLTGPPYRKVDVDTNNVDGNGNMVINTTLFNPYEYPIRNSQGSMKFPYRSGLLKGYQHEEIYRFGIQFFDKEKAPYFTKWIGDIKFPSYGDTNNNPDAHALANGISDFRLSYLVGTSEVWSQIMYIKFSINVTSIADQIGGYQIVRVPREGNNKTIWGTGVLNPFIGNENTNTDSNPSSNELYLPSCFRSENRIFFPPFLGVGTNRKFYNPFPSQEHVETLNTKPNDEGGNVDLYKSFDCFDHQSEYMRPNYSNGDKIFIRTRLKAINYRLPGRGYYKLFDYADYGSKYPAPGSPGIYDPTGYTVCGVPMVTKTPYDHDAMPYFLMKYIDSNVNYGTVANYNVNIFTIDEAVAVNVNASQAFGSTTVYNRGKDMFLSAGTLCDASDPGNIISPCKGGNTTILKLTSGLKLGTDYGCTPSPNPVAYPVYKMLALYFKWNNNLYGGFGYVGRTNNEYIPCSEYVSTVNDELIINTNIDLVTLGGDVFNSYYDNQKVSKEYDFSPGFSYIEKNNLGVPTSIQSAKVNYSVTQFFPCTTMGNAEQRDGFHINKDLTSTNDTNNAVIPDQQVYYNYHSCENDVKKYFPKPLNFITTDEWINRVHYSQIKFNNETQDSWSVYQANDFYDVEGTYGAINCLISLHGQMHFIQERGIGMLLINPVAMVSTNLDIPVKLGSGETIQRHYYKKLDVGTSHQWSVYRSNNQIVFVDVRSKKAYSYNGESVQCISDTLGQRNYFIKRLHNNVLVNDNPITSKGILTTYDYYHNEFLITILNENIIIRREDLSDSISEAYTIVYSEIMNKFTSNYSFVPNIYINNHKYLLSNISNLTTDIPNLRKSLYLHNYGNYGTFYGNILNNNVAYPSTIKALVNDNPLYTKIFDNLSFMTDAVNDNIEWSDDKNIYPGAIQTPAFPDDIELRDVTFNKIRCYNDYQNTDWVTLTLAKPNNNLRKVEQSFNLQFPRNKVNYDANNHSTLSIFDPIILTKTTFGERLRDKWLNIDLSYPNSNGKRFVVHNLKTNYRISDR